VLNNNHSLTVFYFRWFDNSNKPRDCQQQWDFIYLYICTLCSATWL